jgi:hypothetical protein
MKKTNAVSMSNELVNPRIAYQTDKLRSREPSATVAYVSAFPPLLPLFSKTVLKTKKLPCCKHCDFSRSWLLTQTLTICGSVLDNFSFPFFTKS